MFFSGRVTVAALLFAADAYSTSTISQRDKKTTTCDQYSVSGTNQGVFQNYQFWDFRNIVDSVQNGDAYDADQPPLISATQDEGQEGVTSPYISSFEAGGFWAIRRGIRNPESTVPMTYSAQNFYVSKDSGDDNSTHLTLRTSRNSDFQSVAALKTTNDVLYASLRVRAKFIPSNDSTEIETGAVFGWFTYKSDTQESDIEILTVEDPNQVHFTNQPSSAESDGARKVATLPNGLTRNEWVDYRLDWFPNQSLWYINNVLQFESSDSVPKVGSALNLNLWSNGGTFSKTMSVGSEVQVAVQWMEVAYNLSDTTTASQTNKSKKAVTCMVDGVSVQGQPEVAKKNSAAKRLSTGTALLSLDPHIVLTLICSLSCVTVSQML